MEGYNKTFHRGIGMTPLEASITANYPRVKQNEIKYKKEFKQSKRKTRELLVGEIVYIRNENKPNKMDNEFKEKGTILKIFGNDKFEIKTEKEKFLF